MQILDVKKKAPKWLQNWIWERLGLRLGRIWDGLGGLLDTFAGFLVVLVLEQVAQSAPRLDFRVRNMVVFRFFSCICSRVGETL